MIVDDNPKWWHIRREFLDTFREACWFILLMVMVAVIIGAPD